MSKIQKALDMLREQPGKGSRKPAVPYNDSTPRDGRSDSNGNSVSDRAAAEPPRRNIHLPVDRQDALDEEQLPQEKMKLDLELLRDAGLYPSEDDEDVIAQQFRRIKRPVINLAFGGNQPESSNGNMIMVASALPRSGKTWCSINLAASIARERDLGAVLVDADVLKPNISRALGLQDRVGLIDHLLDETISVDEIIVPTDFHDIVVIPAGQQHKEATELLASNRMEHLVASLSQRFRSRAVVVDTPPLLLTNEAHVLAEHMGQIVMVIEAGVSTQQAVLQALESLNRTKPINAILNKARGGFFGDYAGGYGYYSTPRKGYKIYEEEK